MRLLLAGAVFALTTCMTASVGSGAAHAGERDEVSRVVSGLPLARSALVDRGVRRYLRYRIVGEVWAPLDIVTREVREANVGGKDQLTVTSRYFGIASPSLDPTSETVSVVDAVSFVPVSHRRGRYRDGTLTTESYLFSQQSIAADPTVSGSANADFAVALAEPTYNFELDLELLEALDWSDGAVRVVNFYHPGGATAPADYTFIVTGSQTIESFGGGEVPCWVVSTDYNRPNQPPAKFWIAKDGQAVLRVEQAFPGGSTIVKQLIGAAD